MEAPNRMRNRRVRRCGAAALAFAVVGLVRAATPAGDLLAFTDRYCSSCHNDVDREGGLDLTSIKYSPEDPANFLTWAKVHDRVQAGEMPPKEKKRPNATEMSAFVKALNVSLVGTIGWGQPAERWRKRQSGERRYS